MKNYWLLFKKANPNDYEDSLESKEDNDNLN